MNLTARLLILHARKWKSDQDPAKPNEAPRSGVTVTYLAGLGGFGDDERGTKPVEVNCPAHIWSELAAVPGFYDASLEIVQKGGKDYQGNRKQFQEVRPISLRYVAELKGPKQEEGAQPVPASNGALAGATK